ncbi:hypothetical protein [Micromonospora sp. WMMD736]|uniref:hypothetical protein n=1 Tax=Micromonospora sp. WMMD736 TaxID=3404112 RepID=UPI003B9539CA
MAEIFDTDLFQTDGDESGLDRALLAYRRLKYVTAALDLGEPLLQRPEYLHPLLEWAAIRDPSLFHVLMLHHCMATGAVLDFGAAHAAGHLAALVQADAVGAVLLTELGHGNSNVRVGTTATYDPDRHGFTLRTPGRAAVKYPPSVGADGVSRLGIVAAELIVDGRECGSFLFAVPIRDEDGPCEGVGVQAQPATALLPMDYAAVAFDDVRLPFEAWLPHVARIAPDGGFSDPVGSPEIRRRITLTLTRFAWDAVVIGQAAVTRAAVAIALPHAYRRTLVSRAFDRPVPAISMVNQQHTLLTALAGARVAQLIADAVRRTVSLKLNLATLRVTSLRKVTVTRLAEHTIALCRQSAGALGFFSINRFVDYQGLAQAYNSAAADNQMLLIEAAWGMVSAPGYDVPESTPPVAGDDLHAPATWLRLAYARERELHRQLLERLDGSVTPATFNAQLVLAERFAEAVAFRDTVQLLGEEADPDLLAIHVLSTIIRDAADFVGAVPAELLRALPDALNEACERVAPRALELAAGLDVPPGLTRAALDHDYIGAHAAGVA